MSLLSTVVVPPKVPHEQIKRVELEGKLDAVDASRVTTVFAPAGYGKTMAVLRWADMLAEKGRPVLWLAPRAGIRNFDDFIEALRMSCVAAGIAWTEHDNQKPSATFAMAAAEQSQRPVLVIDDAQVLPTEVFDFVSDLVSSARDALTTIIVSRSLNTIPISRLRALGYLFEVGCRDLAFTLDEVRRVTKCVGSAKLNDAQLTELLEDTEGWPAGITLTRMLDDRENAHVRPSGLRGEFESYFSEEVMSLEPEEIRDFLASTIVLDELTPDACAAVTGCEDARLMLSRVEQSGLFLRATGPDRTSFRYHPLFRTTVLRRLNDLDPKRATELQRRASDHFSATGQYKLSIEHARLSGDVKFLADQLDELAEPLTYCGFLYYLDDVASTLPSAFFAGRPRLALAIAWRRTRSLAFESAEALIGLAQAEIARREAEKHDPLDLQQLHLSVHHRQLMLAAARDDMGVIDEEARELLRKFGDNEPYLSCTLLAQLMTARRELYHFNDILRLEAESRLALERPGSEFAAIALKTSMAPTLAIQGKVEAAENMLREALDYAKRTGQAGVAALPALPLAEMLYDKGHFDEASQLVETYLPVAREWGFADQIASGYLVKARLLYNKGNLAEADQALEALQVMALQCGLERLRALAVSEQVHLLARRGSAKNARSLLESSDLFPEEDPFPTLSPTRSREAIATAVIRIAMQEHSLQQAKKIAKRWVEFLRRSGAVRSCITFELLVAEISILTGDRSEARRAVREAVQLAAPNGWTQIFIDEGEPIHTILVDAYGQGPALESVPDRFGQDLVKCIQGVVEKGEEDLGLAGRLMNREIEILRMVGGGLRNREIGDRLGLTEGTVKWYMQQIYDKLGVRRRPQAVTRARQLGVLA